MAERSRDFLRRKAIERIISEIYGDKRFTDGNGHQATPFRDLAGNARLLQMLSTAYSRSGRNFDPASEVGDPDDLPTTVTGRRGCSAIRPGRTATWGSN